MFDKIESSWWEKEYMDGELKEEQWEMEQ